MRQIKACCFWRAEPPVHDEQRRRARAACHRGQGAATEPPITRKQTDKSARATTRMSTHLGTLSSPGVPQHQGCIEKFVAFFLPPGNRRGIMEQIE